MKSTTFARALGVFAALLLVVAIGLGAHEALAGTEQNRNRSGYRMATEQIVCNIGRSAVATEVDTGCDLPATGLIIDAYIYVTTAEATGATKTLHLGTLSSETGGDADGFAVSASVAATGIVQLNFAGTDTRGALLKETETDSGAATHSSRKPYDVAANTAKSISRTLATNDWAEFVGYLVLIYSPLPTAPLP